MIHGTPNSIAVRLRNALAAEGVAISDNALDRVVEALHVPLGTTPPPNPPGWKHADAGLAWEEAIGGEREDSER